MSYEELELLRIHGDLPCAAGAPLAAVVQHVIRGTFTNTSDEMRLSCFEIAARQHAIVLTSIANNADPHLATRIAESTITFLASASRKLGVPTRETGYPTHRMTRPKGLASHHASGAAARLLASATRPTPIQFLSPAAQLTVTVEFGRPFGLTGAKESMVCSEIITTQQTRLGTLLHIRSGATRIRLLLPPEFDPSRVKPGCLIESTPILGRVRRRIVSLRPCQNNLAFA